MPGPAALLNILVTANTSQATASLAKTEAQLKGVAATAQRSTAATSATVAKQNAVFSRMAKTGALAAGAIGVASIKMAADFEDAMVQISTQAGASMEEVEKLKGPVLDLARASEFGPVELAKGLFRVESASYRGAEAMRILKSATDLADVGHANLEETTRAYVAAIRSGIKGTQDFNQAAGLMNAIVGQGSMRMDDLVAAFGTGLLPRAKAVGLGLDEVGAALGVLTEQGMGASQSATRLGMTLAFMVRKPTTDAAAALSILNIKQGEMAKMLLEPNGLLKVLTLLHDRLQKIPEAQRAAVLGQMFGGGRSGAAIQVLISSLDQYEKKLGSVRAQSSEFSKKIAEDNLTLSSKVAAAIAYISADITELGMHINNALNFLIKLINVFRRIAEQGGIVGNTIRTLAQYLKLAATGPTLLFIAANIKLFNLLKKVANAFLSVKDAAVGAFTAIKGPVVDAGKAIISVLAKIVRVVASVIEGFQKLKEAPGNLLDKGVGAIKDLVPGVQVGGRIVGGSGSGDKVMALLEPGEVIWNRQAVKALGGSKRANAMNRIVPRFAGGGVIGAGVEQAGQLGAGLAARGGMELLRVLAKRAGPRGAAGAGKMRHYARLSGDTDFSIALGMALSRMAKAAGTNISVTSGYRSAAEQAALFAANPNPMMVARPGTSHHQLGIAADISPGRSVFGRLAGRFGLRFPMSWEPWHIELAKYQKGGVVKGKTSVFGPPLEAAGTTASGVSSSLPGIALYNRSTLGKMFRVTVGGHSANLRQTDIGPAPWTGRKIDITGAGVRALGLNPRNFPTDTFGKARLLSTLSGKHTGTTGKTAATTLPSQTMAGFAGGDIDAMNAMVGIENTRRGSINELRAAQNLLALQGYQVGAAQNPILGLASPTRPTAAPMMEMVPEFGAGSGEVAMSKYGAKWGFHTHVYIDGKEVRHVTKKQMKRAARGGRRRLPSAGGG